MTATDGTDTAIPARLSELQQYILAFISSNSRTATTGAERDAVQNAVLDEFGEYRRSTPLGDTWNKEPITAAGSSALSRSLARLEERGLIERERSPSGFENPHTAWVSLTPEGKRVATELLRRCSDGRYSLAFETL